MMRTVLWYCIQHVVLYNVGVSVTDWYNTVTVRRNPFPHFLLLNKLFVIQCTLYSIFMLYHVNTVVPCHICHKTCYIYLSGVMRLILIKCNSFCNQTVCTLFTVWFCYDLKKRLEVITVGKSVVLLGNMYTSFIQYYST